MKLRASEMSVVLAVQVSETGEIDIGEGGSKIFQTSGISCHIPDAGDEISAITDSDPPIVISGELRERFKAWGFQSQNNSPGYESLKKGTKIGRLTIGSPK